MPEPPELDVLLLRAGFVTLYWSRDVLARDRERLAALGYAALELDAASGAGWDAFCAAIGSARPIAWPCVPSDGLDDLLWFVWEDLAASAPRGTVVVLRNYDALLRSHPDSARFLVGRLANSVRVGLVHGYRIVVLVQSADPRTDLGEVGGMRVAWNPAEFLNAARGV